MPHRKSRPLVTRHFSLPRRMVDREAYILSCCTGKRVLHVGCVGSARSPDWGAAVRSGKWLHARIQEVASEAIGIDIQRDLLVLLRDQYGVSNLHVCDAEHLENLDMGTFDVILAGEVIEHLASPGRFLGSARGLLGPDGSLVITTVNTYCARRFLRVLFGAESVHADHVAYYSHRTVQRLGETYGYRVVERASYRITGRSPLLPFLVERIACLVSPNLGEGVVCRMCTSAEASSQNGELR